MPATEKTVLDTKKLHVVFAASAVVLFVAVLSMMWKDHNDEWRDYQKTALAIEVKIAEAKFAALNNVEFEDRVKELQFAKDEATASLGESEEDITRLEGEIRDAAQQVDLRTRSRRVQNALRDVAGANYDLGVRDQLPEGELQSLFAKFEARKSDVAETTQELDEWTVTLEAKKAELGELTAERDRISEELKTIQADVVRAHENLQKIAPDGMLSRFKREIMEWPIIDGFNSHLFVRQDWLPELDITLGMSKTARFDRCRTCHINSDRAVGTTPSYPYGKVELTKDDGTKKTQEELINEWVATNKFPHPYASHPHPELFTTATSPHPVETYGCTVCHDGNGSGTSFQNAEHGPNNPWQAHEWEKEHHYHSNHYWELPMQPARFVESSCIKCHHDVVELGVNPKFGASAPKAYAGYRLIQKYGCFGCHEIHGYDGGEPIGPDLRLEPQTAEQAKKIAEDPTQIAGSMRKVGPALDHIAQKTNQNWTRYWTEIPSRFRPTTRMPQFFSLKNGGQYDEKSEQFEPVELAALTEYLFARSTDIELEKPAADYEPNIERGKKLFSERGCMACHAHKDFPDSHAEFGPDLSRVAEKINRDPDDPNFSDWLYTWIRHPEKYHTRTKMPNVYLNVEQKGGETIDPAADISAFLLQGKLGEYDLPEISVADLDDLASVYLRKALTEEQLENTISGEGRYPTPTSGTIKGDESELFLVGQVVSVDGDTTLKVEFTYPVDTVDPNATLIWSNGVNQNKSVGVAAYGAEGGILTLDSGVSGVEPGDAFVINSIITSAMKMRYVGKRTIGRYGCYACHSIPGFEDARPIGAALQGWGRKDTSKLALEHIEEWLHHHGEPDGSSTFKRAESVLGKARAGGVEAGEFDSEEDAEKELAVAYYVDSLNHHGRPGFIWQKLRQPRSYDYRKTELKGYDERLRMPKFPFNEDEIEEIATFVLGLVADPPNEQYVYRPEGAAKDRIEGEGLLTKYNCSSCHMLDMPSYQVALDTDLNSPLGLAGSDYPNSVERLLKMRPPTGATGDSMTLLNFDDEEVEREVYEMHGLLLNEDEGEYSFQLWDPMKIGDGVMMPGELALFMDNEVHKIKDARGGKFAQWLVNKAVESSPTGNPTEAWNTVPPPLYQEGHKVQTPWLYRFLKNPHQLRHLTVLRMPKFNMSDEEAQTLANYFAAVDGVPYPYQQIEEVEKEYLMHKNAELKDLLDAPNQDAKTYQEASWKLLNAQICIGCHAVGGRMPVAKPAEGAVASAAPQVKRGPNLEYAAERLRPEWTELWIRRPSWITPYTAMPVNFPKDQQKLKRLLDGDPEAQVTGLRDALFNYTHFYETIGKENYVDPDEAKKAAEAAGGQ